MSEKTVPIAKIESALQRCAANDGGALSLITALFDALRPPRRRNTEEAIQNWHSMNSLLTEHIEYREGLCRAMMALFAERRQLSFYTDAGLLPNSSFFSELGTKLTNKWLPELLDPLDLKDSIGLIFHQSHDHELIGALPLPVRQSFWQILNLPLLQIDALHQTLQQLLDAVMILSHRLAAMGLEPELQRVTPRIKEGNSPFIALNAQLMQFIERYRNSLADIYASVEDEKHVLVMLDQCREAVNKAHQVAASRGTSMSLTFLLVRATQHVERLELLIQLLSIRFSEQARQSIFTPMLTLFESALAGELQRNSIRSHSEALLKLLALRITENAGKTGAHYIADTRPEWLQMWYSAGGAGIVIALMAISKFKLMALYLAPINETVGVAIIYNIGFLLVHFLHFTVATKQPAMTAAAIAGTISQARGRLQDMDRLIDIIIKTLRSQLAAIGGNVLVAFPLAVAIAWASMSGKEHLIGVSKANGILIDLDSVHSWALLHAAIAGVWLFCSGIVSGYVDNAANYSQLGARIAIWPLLNRLLGGQRAARIGSYLQDNAGGLAGNVFIGVMLAVTPLLGAGFGLPLDVRHVALSAANFGYALVALDFQVDWLTILKCSIGLGLVGAVNLSVSFALALALAMRSRGAKFRYANKLLPLLVERFKKNTAIFFIPPREVKNNTAL